MDTAQAPTATKIHPSTKPGRTAPGGPCCDVVPCSILRIITLVLGSVFLLLSLVLTVAGVTSNFMLWSFFVAAIMFASHVFVMDLDNMEDTDEDATSGHGILCVRRRCAAVLLMLCAGVSFICVFSAITVLASLQDSAYYADYVLGLLAALVVAAISLVTVVLKWKLLLGPTSKRPVPCCSPFSNSCSSCCAFGGLPVVLLLMVGTMVSQFLASHELRTWQPPGKLVETSGPTLHVYCTGDIESNGTTVLFMHAKLGMGLDSEWLRRNLDVKASVRFCSVDRPLLGWSTGDPTPVRERNGDTFAGFVLEALDKLGIVGDFIFVWHLHGAWYGQSLAIRLSQDATRTLVGVVSADGNDPRYILQTDMDSGEFEERSADICNLDGPDYEDASFFLFRLLTPSGITDIMFDSGFLGYRALVEYLPDDIYNLYRSRLVTLPCFDGMIWDDQQYFRVCGSARANLAVLQTPEIVRVEFLVLAGPGYRNLTSVAELGPDDGRTNLVLLTTYENGDGDQVEYDTSTLVTDQFGSVEVQEALVRVIEAVTNSTS